MRLARPELRYAPLWLGLGLLIAACIVLGSLVPSSDLPEFRITDKFRHLFAYMLLSFWYASVLRQRLYAGLVVALLLFGAGIELLQAWMGLGREADVMDLLANATGIVLGLLLAISPVGRWTRVAEDLLQRRGTT